MLAIVALVCFALAAFGLGALGFVALVPLGLAFLAAHLVVPVALPWRTNA